MARKKIVVRTRCYLVRTRTAHEMVYQIVPFSHLSLQFVLTN